MTVNHVFSDQDLSCFLDGEAPAALSDAISEALSTDPRLRARLEELRAGEHAFVEAMGTALVKAPKMPPLTVAAPAPAKSAWKAGLIGVAAGVIAAIGVAWSVWPSQDTGWRDVVASYQSLYVTETLALVDQPPADQQADLKRLSENLGLDLTALPEVAGLSYKRSQQLGFRGEPLAQLTYLTAEGGPVALCIFRTDGGSSPDISSEVLSGLDTYNWTDNGFGVVLVGPRGNTRLENAAEIFRSALKAAAA